MEPGFPELVDIDLSPDLLACRINIQGDLLRANRSFLLLFDSGNSNYSFRDTLSDHDFNILCNDFKECYRKDENILHTELKHQLPSAEPILVKWQFFAFKKSKDLFFTAVGYVQHTDEEHAGIPQVVINSLTDGFFVLDANKNFINVNQGIANLLSKSIEEVEGTNASGIFGSRDSALYSRQLSRCFSQNEPSNCEVHFPQLDQWWFFVVYPSSDQLIVYAKNISQRKHYEISLKQSQSKLRAILNSTSEANLLLNKDYAILSYNKAAELMAKKVLGVNLEEGMSFMKVLPKVNRKRFEEKFNHALEGNSIKYEREVKGIDNNVYWFRLTFFPVIDEDEYIIGVAFNAENIRERKEAEEKLNMYTLIAGHITDAVIITDARGLTTWVNESFIRKTGYTLEDMYGLAPGDVLQGPATETLSKQEMHDAVAEGRPFHVEITNYTKAGKPYHVEIKADPYYRSDGKLLGFIAIQPDITHRKKEEDRRIRESWARFHAIFENSINAILLANDEGKLVDANPAACHISGYSREELRRFGVRDLVYDTSKLTSTDDWETFLTHGKMQGTVAIKTKEGDLKILDFRAVADILPGLHLSILSDMTSHYQAEQKILEQNEHLNRLNQEKNQLFSIISHDLRSPLNSVSGLLELMQEDYIEKEAFDKQLGLLSQRVNHSLNLMDNLFKWAQHQLKGIKVEKSEFDLHTIGQSKLALFKADADYKRINITNKVEQNTIIYADMNMIDLVVRNLVANAVKFCQEGDQITISSHKEDQHTLVCVSDTGIGIAREDLSKIFGGIHSTLGTQQEKGSGLGLRICKDFVEQHGGKIWVESERKKGSRFCFTIPNK